MSSAQLERERLEEEIERLKTIDPLIGISDVELVRRARPLAESFHGLLPTSSEVEHLTKHVGALIAGEVFYQTVVRSPRQAELNQRLRAQEPPEIRPVHPKFPEIVVVHSQPAMLTRKWGDHVPVWRQWARASGFRTDEIITSPKALISENVDAFEEFFAKRNGEACIVVTYGQGAAEFRFWYERRYQNEHRKEMTAGIKGWIDVCGTAFGSTFAQQLSERSVEAWVRRLRFRLAGRDVVTQKELEPRFEWWASEFAPEAPLWRVAIVGLPQELPRDLQEGYDLISREAPNDGRQSLIDSLGPDPNSKGLGLIPMKNLSADAQNSALRPTFLKLLNLIREDDIKALLE